MSTCRISVRRDKEPNNVLLNDLAFLRPWLRFIMTMRRIINNNFKTRWRNNSFKPQWSTKSWSWSSQATRFHLNPLTTHRRGSLHWLARSSCCPKQRRWTLTQFHVSQLALSKHSKYSNDNIIIFADPDPPRSRQRTIGPSCHVTSSTSSPCARSSSARCRVFSSLSSDSTSTATPGYRNTATLS